ncbi:MAG TPA: hypothetical protein EYP88_05430 [Anaerolineales bacterium]|nr:hypothetical protein [Anaerolineales bacterium]
MSKNIYLHELRIRIRSVIIWSLGILALHLLYLSFYGIFADQAALVNEMMENFPPEFRAAFGMDGVDLSQVLGYYSFILTFAQICLAIQAGNYGFGLVSVEESEMTADFLLSKPVSRARILTSKTLAAITSLTITNAVVWIGAFTFINLFRSDHEYDPGTLSLMLASIIFFQLFFFSVGAAVSLLVKRVRNVTPYGLGLGFGMYVLAAFGDMLGESKLEWITPFKHFDAGYIVQHQGYDMRLFGLSVSITVIALAISYWRYLRRDIPSAV